MLYLSKEQEKGSEGGIVTTKRSRITTLGQTMCRFDWTL